MIAGAYTLHLYCEYESTRKHPYSYFPHEFIGETGGEARRLAREAGWKIDMKNRIEICPLCVQGKTVEIEE